ncbi:hypothetical protein [Sulfuriflexus mobilis]|uniref:hypothetical protein n=1 Tax=Sulfuriflexus mobilis TaxID=1811807 RepID=UPI000F823DA7|nr:hypothetical protein [Sulfuriflexus mobilis]
MAILAVVLIVMAMKALQTLVAERSMIFVDVETDNFKKLLKSHDENVRQANERIGKFMDIAIKTGLADSEQNSGDKAIAGDVAGQESGG